MTIEATYLVTLAPATGDFAIVPWSPSPVPDPAVFTFVGPGSLTSKDGPAIETTIALEVEDSGAMLPRSIKVATTTATGVVTGAVLRTVPVGQLVRVATRLVAQGGDLANGRTWSAVGLDESPNAEREHYDDRDWLPPLRGKKGHEFADREWVANLRRLGPSHPHVARSVAALYRLAEGLSQPPIAYVSTLTGLPASTVSHWVKIARQVGTLPPSARKSRASRDA